MPSMNRRRPAIVKQMVSNNKKALKTNGGGKKKNHDMILRLCELRLIRKQRHERNETKRNERTMHSVVFFLFSIPSRIFVLGSSLIPSISIHIHSSLPGSSHERRIPLLANQSYQEDHWQGQKSFHEQNKASHCLFGLKKLQ